MTVQNTTVVAILAGGRAQRMGGIDKCLLPWGQGTLLSNLLSQISLPVVLNASPPHTRFDDYDLPIVADRFAQQLGPLAGIEACLGWAQAQGFERVVTLAGDMPNLPLDFFEKMRADENTQADLLLATDRHGWVQPILGNWSVKLRAPLAQALTQGTRKVRAFTDAQAVQWIPFDYDFININTQADYESVR